MESSYWQAIIEGNSDQLSNLIGTTPGLVHASDIHGKTGLHWAAELDNVEVARMLMDAGADVEARSSWGASPLDWAATMGGAAVAEMLLARGAIGLTLITSAALGKLILVKNFAESGADLSSHRRRDAPEIPNEHWPAESAHILGDILSDALYAAARNGHTKVVAYLLSRGADVNARGVFGATALHWAAINGWVETVELLLSSGARADLKDDRFDAYPDGWAEEGGYGDLADILRRGR